MSKVSRYFDDVKVKPLRQFYMYPKCCREVLYTTGDHGAVPPVPIITIQYNYCTRGSTSRVFNDYTI